jgi:hypothetical protein
MWKAEGFFTAICFGFDFEHLYLRLDPDTSLVSQRADLRIECRLQTPVRTYRVEIPHFSSDHYLLTQQREDGDWQEPNRSALVACNQILELALPFKELHVEEGQTLQMTLLVQGNGLELARYPRHQPVTIIVPGPEFEASVWRV